MGSGLSQEPAGHWQRTHHACTWPASVPTPSGTTVARCCSPRDSHTSMIADDTAARCGIPNDLTAPAWERSAARPIGLPALEGDGLAALVALDDLAHGF